MLQATVGMGLGYALLELGLPRDALDKFTFACEIAQSLGNDEQASAAKEFMGLALQNIQQGEVMRILAETRATKESSAKETTPAESNDEAPVAENQECEEPEVDKEQLEMEADRNMEELLKTEDKEQLQAGEKEVRIKRKQKQKMKKRMLMAEEAARKLEEAAGPAEVVNQVEQKCKAEARLEPLKVPVGLVVQTPKKAKMKEQKEVPECTAIQMEPMMIGISATWAADQTVAEETTRLSREVLLRHRLGSDLSKDSASTPGQIVCMDLPRQTKLRSASEQSLSEEDIGKLRLPSNASLLSLSTFDGCDGVHSDTSTSHSDGQKTPPMSALSPPPGLQAPPGLELSLGGLPQKVEPSLASLSYEGPNSLSKLGDMRNLMEPRYIDIKDRGLKTTGKADSTTKRPTPKFCPYCGSRCGTDDVPSCQSCGTSLSWMMAA